MGPRKHFKMPKKQGTLPETENRPSGKDTSSFNHQFSGNMWGHVSFRKGSLQRTIFCKAAWCLKVQLRMLSE